MPKRIVVLVLACVSLLLSPVPDAQAAPEALSHDFVVRLMDLSAEKGFVVESATVRESKSLTIADRTVDVTFWDLTHAGGRAVGFAASAGDTAVVGLFKLRAGAPANAAIATWADTYFAWALTSNAPGASVNGIVTDMPMWQLRLAQTENLWCDLGVSLVEELVCIPFGAVGGVICGVGGSQATKGFCTGPEQTGRVQWWGNSTDPTGASRSTELYNAYPGGSVYVAADFEGENYFCDVVARAYSPNCYQNYPNPATVPPVEVRHVEIGYRARILWPQNVVELVYFYSDQWRWVAPVVGHTIERSYPGMEVQVSVHQYSWNPYLTFGWHYVGSVVRHYVNERDACYFGGC